jgi:lipoate-protein ligase A
VHHAIRKSLAEQGVAVSLYETAADETVKASKDDPFLCFQRRAIGDLICDGAKVGGSAQRRLKNSLIQHGSLLLSKSEFTPELPGLKEQSGVEVDAQRLIDGVRQQLEETLGITFVADETSANEQTRAHEIEAEKFGSAQWLEKR